MDTTPHSSATGSPATSPEGRLATGTLLRGRFAVEQLVGRTALGEIYSAIDATDGKSVLVKLFAPELVRDTPTRIRLQQDATIAAQLSHKNIATSYGFFTDGNNAFLASEPVDGQTLRQMLDGKRQSGVAFSLRGAFSVVVHLCNALEYAHGAQLHGLLGLDTVHVNKAGRVKIADFGLARALAPQERFRTALGLAITSMAPEFFAPGTPDRRADIYSVGAILFELLVGRSREGETEAASSLVPGLPPALDLAIDRCLAAVPEERFNDAHALKLAMQSATEAALAERAGAGRPPPPPTPPPPSRTAPTLPKTAAVPKRAAPPVAPTTQGAGSALTAVDEAHERWLIQKDRLDLGPFKLADVKSQIESGKILGEHTIIDMENGTRARVREHPLLRDLVTKAEGVLQAMREVEQSRAEHRAHKKRVMTMVAIIGGAVIVAGGAVTAYVITHRPKPQGERIVEKVVLKDSDDFKFELSLKVEPPPPKSARKRSSHGSGGKNAAGDFDSATNLGDASGDGGDETLGRDVVQKVMTANFRSLVGCVREEKSRNAGLHTVDMEFVIKGTGTVSAVKVNGATTSPLASCMYGKMVTIPFPKFNGSKTVASFSLALK